MTRHLSVFVVALFGPLAAAATHAQTAPYDIRTLPYDHVHLSVPDPAKAADWYAKHMSGTRVEGAAQVKFGDVRFSFRQAEKAPPSAGTVIDHIGFSFALLDLKLAELEAAGAKVTSPARDVEGLFRLAFIEDPWGVRVELVQDKDTLGFHHIHLRSTDPEGMLKWVENAFGGERTTMRGRLDGVKHGGNLWIFVQKANEAPKPSMGTAIDHIGWRTPDLDRTAANLKAKGVRFTTEPRAAGDLRISFIEGPDALRVELLQRP